MLGSVSGLQTAQAAATPKTQGPRGAKPKMQGPTITYPHAPGDNPLPAQFIAYGRTDDFTDTITAVMSKGTDTVNGTITGVPSQYQPSWTASFNMGVLHGTGWTLTITQGSYIVTSTSLQVGYP